MSDINRITCVDCGKHIVTEEREHVGGKIKVIEGRKWILRWRR